MRPRFAILFALAFFGFAAAAHAEDDGTAQVKAADVTKGAQLFTTYCVTCHGPTGLGDGPVGKTLNPPPRNFQEGFQLVEVHKEAFNTQRSLADGAGN